MLRCQPPILRNFGHAEGVSYRVVGTLEYIEQCRTFKQVSIHEVQRSKLLIQHYCIFLVFHTTSDSKQLML